MTRATTKTRILLITAAGASSRMGGKKKEFLPLNSGTVLSECALCFTRHFSFGMIVVTCPKGRIDEARAAFFADPEVERSLGDARVEFTEGGSSRQESVFFGLKKAKEFAKACGGALVLIHDGARPFVKRNLIAEAIEAAEIHGAAVPALEPVDTQKEAAQVAGGRIVSRHLLRKDLCAVQTPQCFDFEPLLEAHEEAARFVSRNPGAQFTDDTEIWDRFANPDGSRPVFVTRGDAANRKITYASDIEGTRGTDMQIRTGLGYDLHPLAAGRRLVLGGVEFDFEKGEAGHSDGDVLLHAITDALLGAAALGDIGSFFPPEDEKWKDADSALLLESVWEKVRAEGWRLCNLDCVIGLEKPKFLPRREEVRASIARILGVDSELVFVKAKTGEKMGKIGRGEAVEAFAACLLQR